MRVIVIDANTRQIDCQKIGSADEVAAILADPDFDHVTVSGNVVALVGEHSWFAPGQRFIELLDPKTSNSAGVLRGTAVVACLEANGDLGSIDGADLGASGWIDHLKATTKFLRPFRTGHLNRPVALTDDAGDHIVHHPALRVVTLTQEDFTNGPL